MNCVQLVGRLTKDIEIRQTNNGTMVGSFTLAVRKDIKTEGGEDADFIQCVAWKKTCDIIRQYTHKGSQIGITGRINTRNYDDANGRKVYVTEVIVDRVELLDSKQQDQPKKEQPASNTTIFNASIDDIQF